LILSKRKIDRNILPSNSDGLPAGVGDQVLAELEKNYRRILSDLQTDNLPLATMEIWSSNENFLSAMEKSPGQRYPGATGYVKYEGVCLLNSSNSILTTTARLPFH
jgi:hypothetical protein